MLTLKYKQVIRRQHLFVAGGIGANPQKKNKRGKQKKTTTTTTTTKINKKRVKWLKLAKYYSTAGYCPYTSNSPSPP